MWVKAQVTNRNNKNLREVEINGLITNELEVTNGLAKTFRERGRNKNKSLVYLYINNIQKENAPDLPKERETSYVKLIPHSIESNVSLILRKEGEEEKGKRVGSKGTTLQSQTLKSLKSLFQATLQEKTKV